ncbi:MAG: hypothetical protein J5927_00560 [Oscillospiraceae bacterium]|nr:hypothetical protein [Oscillospiraceae bacterium]
MRQRKTRLGALLLAAALLLGGCGKGKTEPEATPAPSGPYAGIRVNPLGDAKKIETGELRAPVLVVLLDGSGVTDVVHSLSGPYTDDPAQAATTVFLYEASYYDGNAAERYRKEDNAWKAYVNVLNAEADDYLRLATDSEEWGENGQVCFKTPDTCYEDRRAREQMYLEFLRNNFAIRESAAFDSQVVSALLNLGSLPEVSFQRVYELLNLGFVGDPETWEADLSLQTDPKRVPMDCTWLIDCYRAPNLWVDREEQNVERVDYSLWREACTDAPRYPSADAVYGRIVGVSEIVGYQRVGTIDGVPAYAYLMLFAFFNLETNETVAWELRTCASPASGVISPSTVRQETDRDGNPCYVFTKVLTWEDMGYFS